MARTSNEKFLPPLNKLYYKTDINSFIVNNDDKYFKFAEIDNEDINDDLLERAKAVAQSRHQSLGEIIADELRVVLSQNTNDQIKNPVRLVTFQGSGTCPGIDLDSNAALLDAMEAR